MDKILPTLEIVLPLFLIILLGYILRQVKLLPESFAHQSSRLLFFVILPLVFVEDLWNADLSQGYPLGMLLSLLLGLVVTGVVAWLLSKMLHVQPHLVPSFVHSSIRSNFFYVGYSLLRMMFSDLPSTVSISFLVIMTLFNISISIIYPRKEKSQNPAEQAWSILKAILTNPLNMGLMLGLLLNLLKIPQPKLAQSTLSMVTAMSSPLALLSIGVAFNLQVQKSYLKLALVSAAVKLIAAPLIGMGIGMLFGLSSQELLIIFIIFGTPTALNTFAIDREMGKGEDFVATAILISTILSMLTLTLFVFAFLNLGQL